MPGGKVSDPYIASTDNENGFPYYCCARTGLQLSSRALLILRGLGEAEMWSSTIQGWWGLINS